MLCTYWLTIVGLTCNGFGVFFLAHEVYLAHKTEEFIYFLRRSLKYAEALHKDPLGQSQRDLEELETKINSGKATNEEKSAYKLQKAVRDSPLNNEYLKAMQNAARKQADELKSSLTETSQAMDAHLAPTRLKRRRKLLIAGAVLLLLGNVLQGLGAHLEILPAATDNSNQTQSSMTF